jgi:3'(2'), 5'-bisphosphate nucleotidase
VENNVDDYELIQKGSSIKFCEIAEGKVDLYPRFGSTSEWDTAAGHVILVEAGGEIKSIDDEKILYNNKKSVINPPFIASCKLDK